MHPKAYRDEIERAIHELLVLGHIRPSTSPFASFVILVKKKDGTLRMCIDYRALMKKTVKADFRKGDIEWAVELRVSEVGSTGQTVQPDVQSILDRYAMVFREIPPGQLPDRGFEHTIELEQGI